MHFYDEIKRLAKGVSQTFRNVIAKERLIFSCRPLFAVALFLSVIANPNICSSPLFAQNNTSGDIAGSVTDPTGATIPGAKVTIVDKATGATQILTTGSNGNFRASLLKPDSYTVAITMAGFQSITLTVAVTPGQIAQADVKLPVGSSTTSVEVAVTEPLLHTENADLTTSFTQDQVQSLPNPGNDLTFIAQTSPGAIMNTQGGFGNFSSFGLPATSNTFTVNGGYENDPFLNLSNSGASNLLLGNNDVSEVTVTSNAYSAQFGGLGATQVNEISRSGSNRFHGDATWWWNGSALNGNDYFNNQSGTPRPRSNANQWAGAFSGPVRKDKTFFFFNTEGLRVIIPVRGTVYAPSPSYISKTLANAAAQGPAATAFYQHIFDLYTSNPAYATATLSSTDSNSVSYNANSANFAHEWLITTRIDHKISDRDTLFGHAKIDKGVQPTSTSLLNPLFNAASPQPEYEGQLNETHIFTPNVTNQFVFAAIYYRAIFTNTNAVAANALVPFTLQFSDGDLVNNLNNASGKYSTLPGGENFQFPQGRNVTGYQFVDDFSMNKGRHTIKLGFAFRRDDVTDYGPGFNTTPLVVTSEASFEAGTADQFVQQFPTRESQPVALYTLGLYAQDQWKLASNFTLNFGMRFEHNSNPICKTDCFSQLAENFGSVANSTEVPYTKLISTGLNSAFQNFQKVGYEPRVGFSWSPLGADSKTVLRGGFGMFADSFPAQIIDSLLNNAPNNIGFTIQGPAGGGPSSPIVPGAAGSFQSLASASSVAFQNQFRAGGSNDSLSASVPGFAAPSFTSTVNKLSYPTYEEWNLQVEHQVTHASSISVGYVGNHGYHEPVNDNNVNAFNAGIPGFASLPTSIPNPNFAAVTQVYTGASSNYNGVTLSGIHRTNVLTLQFNYTYSHALDEISNGGFNGFSGNSVFPSNSANLHQNYGNADYDVRHYISGNYIFNLPSFRGPRILTAGWQAAGTVFHSTGLPFTFTDANTASNLPNHGGPIFAQQTVAHVPTKCSGHALTQGANCAASLDFTTATDFGQQSRNQVFGPNYTDTDLTITKAFDLHFMESAKLKLGVQMFNLFNHPNFAQPAHDVSACTSSEANPCAGSSIGTITGTVNPPTSILGSFLGGDASPRLIQVKANFSF